MGTSITDWSTVTAEYYTGPGTEALWVFVAIALCVIPLVVGSKHELDAYKKLKK
jgi:hypothetical protein